MKKCKKIWAVVVLLLTAVVAQAQTVTVRGHVVDETGEPMIGATVKAVGQTGGTVTDMDGNYVLSINGKVSQIEVSYIGYRTQKAAVKNGRADVHMSTDANQLEELVQLENHDSHFAIQVGTGNKKANMMGMLKEILGSDYPLEWCHVTRNALLCSPGPGLRLPYQEYFNTI